MIHWKSSHGRKNQVCESWEFAIIVFTHHPVKTSWIFPFKSMGRFATIGDYWLSMKWTAYHQCVKMTHPKSMTRIVSPWYQDWYGCIWKWGKLQGYSGYPKMAVWCGTRKFGETQIVGQTSILVVCWPCAERVTLGWIFDTSGWDPI